MTDPKHDAHPEVVCTCEKIDEAGDPPSGSCPVHGWMAEDDTQGTEMKMRPSQFEHGDRFQSSGDKVIGKTYVRGGVAVDYQRPDGSTGRTRLNGRMKFSVVRP